jgi:hypothetical protein
VDGDISAVGTIDVGGVAGTATAGAAPYTFPSQADIDAFQAELVAAAQVGGTQPSQSYGADVVVNTPVYIDGDFTVSGGHTLTLTGNDVFYVSGNLTVSGGGTILNDGVVAVGGIAQLSGGGGYNLTADPSQTLVVSFSTDQKALELSGGSAGIAQGPAFAPNGGILLNGTSSWRGSLIAGGNTVARGAELSGGSSVTYDNGMNGSNIWLPADDGTGESNTVQVLSSREL